MLKINILQCIKGRIDVDVDEAKAKEPLMFKALNNWRNHRQVLRELAKLSDRDLHDLGIVRTEIKDAARRGADVSARL